MKIQLVRALFVLFIMSLLAGCETFQGPVMSSEEFSSSNESYESQPQYAQPIPRSPGESNETYPAQENPGATSPNPTPTTNPSTSGTNTGPVVVKPAPTSNVIPVISQPVGVAKPTITDKPITNGTQNNDDGSEIRSTPNTE